MSLWCVFFFFFQAEDGIRDLTVTGVQTCALPIFLLRIQQISKDRLEIQQGSLYPALYRLEHQGWIASEWGESENKRKAKYYRLTAAGKRALQTEAEKWNSMADVIASIPGTSPAEI